MKITMTNILPVDAFDALEAARDFLRDHADEGRATLRQCVVISYTDAFTSQDRARFAVWGNRDHLRVRQIGATP